MRVMLWGGGRPKWKKTFLPPQPTFQKPDTQAKACTKSVHALAMSQHHNEEEFFTHCFICVKNAPHLLSRTDQFLEKELFATNNRLTIEFVQIHEIWIEFTNVVINW